MNTLLGPESLVPISKIPVGYSVMEKGKIYLLTTAEILRKKNIRTLPSHVTDELALESAPSRQPPLHRQLRKVPDRV